MEIEVYLVNSFTTDGKGGNPAGVVLHANLLSDQQKQEIAKIVGFSETAFVSNDNECDFKVGFFTTVEEVDFCGHATLAVFSLMFQKGIISSGVYHQRTNVGVLPVTVKEDGSVVMNQQLPVFLGSFTYKQISEVLDIDEEILESTGMPIEVISTGIADAFIPVPENILDTIKPDDKRITDFCREQNILSFHLFEFPSGNVEYTASCRNFSPILGISEESATGSSCGALACYLARNLKSSKSYNYVFEQGRAMGASSRITASVALNGKEITEVKVGGVGTLTGSRFVEI